MTEETKLKSAFKQPSVIVFSDIDLPAKERRDDFKNLFLDAVKADAPIHKKIHYSPLDASGSMRGAFDFKAQIDNIPLTPQRMASRIQELRDYMAQSPIGQDILDYIDKHKIGITLEPTELSIIPEGCYRPGLGKKPAQITIGYCPQYAYKGEDLAQQAIILAHEVFHGMQQENDPWMMFIIRRGSYTTQICEIGAIGFQNMFAAEHLRATNDDNLRAAALITNTVQQMPADTLDKFTAGDYQAAMSDAFVSVFTFPRKNLGYVGKIVSPEEQQKIEALYDRFTAEGHIQEKAIPGGIAKLILALGERVVDRPENIKQVRAMAAVRLPKSGISFNYLDGIGDAYFADEEKFTLLDPAFEKKVRALHHEIYIAPYEKKFRFIIETDTRSGTDFDKFAPFLKIM